MHLFKLITGQSKKNASLSSPSSSSSASSPCSPSDSSPSEVDNPTAKRRLREFAGQHHHLMSKGKVMPVIPASSSKVLQMLGADKPEETLEILFLMNQTRVSASQSLVSARVSTFSEEDEFELGAPHSFDGASKDRAGQPHRAPLSNRNAQPCAVAYSEHIRARQTVPSPNPISYISPQQRSPRGGGSQTAHPLPTPPPSPSSSSARRTMLAQQSLPQSTLVAFPLPKATIERHASHQNSPALQQYSPQGCETSSISSNERNPVRNRPAESVLLSGASTPRSSPRSSAPPPSSVHGSPLPSPPRTPSSQIRSSPQSPSHPSQSILHSPWSLVPVPQCPRIWTKGQKLGQGSFGTVYEGLNQEDGSFFAVKVSCQNDTSPEIQQEVAVLSQLSHPNIVRYLGSSIEDGCLCIFLELVGMGSLDSILRKYKRLEENLICTYTRQILYGLEYLHQHSTIHRDIKCGNILVDVNGQVKLADFGVAKRVDISLADSCKGTPLYMAPEVMKPSSARASYDFSADIWSLGCTILEMADGKPPWSDVPGFGFYFKVSRGELPPIPEHLSADAKDFILKCLRRRPQDRPTASELLQHPFVKNAPKAIPSVPWLPISSSASHHKLPPWFHGVSRASAFANTVHVDSSSQILAGAQRAQALLYG